MFCPISRDMTPPRISKSSVAEWYSALSVINEQIGQKCGSHYNNPALYDNMCSSCTSSPCSISSDCIHVATMEKLHKNFENNWQLCLAEVDLFKVRNNLCFLICLDCKSTTEMQQYSQLFTHRQRWPHTDSSQMKYRILLTGRYYLSLASANHKLRSIWKNLMLVLFPQCFKWNLSTSGLSCYIVYFNIFTESLWVFSQNRSLWQ